MSVHEDADAVSVAADAEVTEVMEEQVQPAPQPSIL